MKSLVAVLVPCIVAAVVLIGCEEKATTYEVKTDSQGDIQLVPVEGNPYEPGSNYAATWDDLMYKTPAEVAELQEWADEELGMHFEIDTATNLLVMVRNDGTRSVVQP